MLTREDQVIVDDWLAGYEANRQAKPAAIEQAKLIFRGRDAGIRWPCRSNARRAGD
jgi:hypothetical protein